MPAPVRGVPKSGRVWKATRPDKTRVSLMNATPLSKPLRTTYEGRMASKAARQAVLTAEKELQDERRAKKEAERKRIEENKKRREENARKSEVTQVIKDTRKIKKMSRKQLRQISKRDTN